MVPARAPSGRKLVEGKCILDVMRMPEVATIVGDQCKFGLTTWVKGREMAARKRTLFMSNAGEILSELGGLCRDTHEHGQLVDGRAREAAIYPPGLCRAICRGYIKQRHMAEQHVKKLLKVTAKDTVG